MSAITLNLLTLGFWSSYELEDGLHWIIRLFTWLWFFFHTLRFISRPLLVWIGFITTHCFNELSLSRYISLQLIMSQPTITSCLLYWKLWMYRGWFIWNIWHVMARNLLNPAQVWSFYHVPWNLITYLPLRLLLAVDLFSLDWWLVMMNDGLWKWMMASDDEWWLVKMNDG